ncbi:uncharacterized protein TM35_000052790 [Trypanosoma theileri]|uniref:Uncharacterized protein n=1 Tax=Trypanosoma theileri TaxID=67003 RepID=A0A1X0P4V3_9TRYP|nr:uncharacterized protein TM35_000052790 [Trypanosoma theileri]ORC91683.1 hypothetical protein TM35_000052790 [Trypanosoma theileri]
MATSRTDSSTAVMLLLRALYPHVSRDSLAAAVRETGAGGVEAAVRAVNAHVNPNSSVLAHVRLAAAAGAEGSPRPPPQQQQQLEQERAALLEEKPFGNTALTDEYCSAVGVFAVDTTAWDAHFLNGATLPDLIGGHPLVLPEERGEEQEDQRQQREQDKKQKEMRCKKGTDMQTPIVCWAPTLEALGEAETSGLPKRMNSNDNVAPFVRPLERDIMICGNRHSDQASGSNMEKGMLEMTVTDDSISANTRTSTVALNKVSNRPLLSPLQYSLLAIEELNDAINKLDSWKSVFSYHESCYVVKDIADHNPAVVSLMPEITSNIIAALQEGLRGVKFFNHVEGIHVPICGGYLVNCGDLSIEEINFGRSYGKFESEGKRLSFRLKVKRLAFTPLSVSYRKVKSKSEVMKKAVCNVVISDMKVKTNVELYLYTSGRLVVRCSDVSVSIGSLYIDCSAKLLKIIGFFLRPLIVWKLEHAITTFLRDTITIGAA